jgi:hypothetical protein
MAAGVADRPVVWWATAGAAVVIFQLYLYGRWVASGPEPTPRPPMPAHIAASAVVLEVIGMAALAAFVWQFVLGPWRRNGRLPGDGILLLAYFTCFWQDLGSNYLHYWVVYNPAWVNLGSWYGFIPGWVPPLANRQPAPLLFFLPMYPVIGFGFTLIGCAALRRAEVRWGRLSPLRRFGVAVVVLYTLDLVLEVAWLRVGVYSYTGVIPSLTLFSGRYYQFPIYIVVFWGTPWAALTCLRYARNDRGETIVEHGSDRLGLSPWRRNAVRFLALAAACNLAWLFFNVAGAAMSTQTHRWADDITGRAYFSYLCSARTTYACPGGVAP